MSAAHYSELWRITRNDMEKLLKLDEEVQVMKPTSDKQVGLNRILPMYLKYRNLVQRIIICHDQVIQSQKRNFIKRVLNCAIGRMLEYKQELVTLDSTDYVWPDDFLIEMKMTSDDVAVTTPTYYVSDRRIHLEHRKKYIKHLIANANKSSELIQDEINDELDALSSNVIEMTDNPSKVKGLSKNEAEASVVQIHMEPPEMKANQEVNETTKKFKDAILLIQTHERARVARSIGALVKREYDYNKKVERGRIEVKKVEKSRKIKAAITIQKTWRGYLTRRTLERRVNRIEKLLGMVIPSWKSSSILDKAKVNFQQRLAMQPLAVQRTEDKMNEERSRVHRVRGPELMEDIAEEIRDWFIVWYDKLGFFDIFPAADVGGSIMMVTGQTLTPEEYLLEKFMKTAQKGKPKEKTAKLDEKKKVTVDKTKNDWRMPESKTLSCLREANNEFIRNWQYRDESKNPNELEYSDLISDKLWYELQLEMREIVDELMRLELMKLNEALMKDHAQDKEPFTVPRPEKEKKSKKKSSKKDPLADFTAEDLFDELVRAKIIRNYPTVHLQDWIGDLSYQNYEAQNVEFREYQYRLGEIKQTIIDHCILPIGSKEVHEVAPLTRSVCICGLPRYGKSFLVNAICSEVGALLFDLTPSVLVGQYVGKKNQERLMNMVAKVSRAFAPSVVFIDGGEKPWWKSVPVEEQHTQPKRLASLLPKFVKAIKPGDQVLFLTTSAEPYKAGKPFIKIHDKFVILPLTDYNTAYLLYKELLMKYHGVDRNFDVSCLAKLSVGFPIDFIRETVEKVMCTRRRISLKCKPLHPQEIVEQLLRYNGPSAKALEQYKKFERQTPLGRKKAKMMAVEKAERDKMATPMTKS